MTRTPHRATAAAAVGLAVVFLAGCYTVAPPPHGVPAGPTPYGYAGYATPSGFISVSVVTRAPRPPRYDGSIWYHGSHPHPENHALGGFCHLRGAHHHDYAPYRGHHFVFHDGYYFWVGDPILSGLRGSFYAYQGHHPHSHYFGGYCRISGRHHHDYAPRTTHSYDIHAGAYHFSGSYNSDYYTDDHRYDTHGSRSDRLVNGYRDHEGASRQQEADDRDEALQTDGVFQAFPAKQQRDRVGQQRVEWVEWKTVDRASPPRKHERRSVDRTAAEPPKRRVHPGERVDSRHITAHERLERRRQRKGAAAANAAEPGAAEQPGE